MQWKIVHMMKKFKIDALFLAETHANTNPTETHDDYSFTDSTSVTDDQRKKY